MPVLPRLVGMVHLGPLPGAPRFRGDLAAVISAAVTDAAILAEAGFDAVLVENFGDEPFFADDVPKVTIAAMAVAVREVARVVQIPVGVNVLRNDAQGAMSIAATAGGAFVRVNVLSGAMDTDQGPVVGKAAELARLRAAIAPDVAVLADVFVKHATPPPGLTIEQATADLVERGGADAVIVSGPGTGREVERAIVESVAALTGDVPVYVGSGATADNAADLLSVAHGVIVGTSLKVGGGTSQAVDAELAAAFVAAAAGPQAD